MTAYEDTVELTGKGDVENTAELLASVELTGKGAATVDSGGLILQDILEITGIGYILGIYNGWSYAKGIKVTNYTGGELTDYPVEVILTTENFDYAKCENDGSDIRFSANNAALSYWIEEWNYNGTSRIWVKASTISNGFNVCFYIHYGKAGEADESNGGNVWNIEFDHFSGDTLDPTKWEEFGTPTSSLTVTVQDGYVKVLSTSYQSRQVGMKSINETLIGTTFRVLMRVKSLHGWMSWGQHNAIGQVLDWSNFNGVYVEHDTDFRLASRTGGVSSYANFEQSSFNWYRYLLKKLETSHHKGKQDSGSEHELTSNIYSGNAPFRIHHLHDDSYSTTHETHLDYIAITDKYASPDPIASLVSEEVEGALISLWTLFQSAEIEGKGAPTLFLSFQHLIELIGTGDTSIDITSAFHGLVEVTGNGEFLPLHVYVFSDIDTFLIENWSVSKTIQDVLWKFTGGIDKLVAPSYFKNFVVTADDHLDVNHIIFLGFIPGADYTLATVANKAILNAFDYGWYLSSQFVPLAIRITDEDTNPADTIKTLLGGDDWMGITGIEPYQIRDVSDWATIKKPFVWNSKTSKWKAIKEICDYTHHVFMVKWRKTVPNNEYYSVAYFVHEDEIDTYLDLPAMQTINNPDPYLESNVKIEDKQEAKYNRVIINGANKITGAWYTKTEQSAGVTSGDELPIEYVYESTDLDSQAKVNAKATELYNFFHTIARVYTASFKKRMDLELYQKIRFIGYDKIEEEEMRIVGITYRRSAVEDIVTIQFTPDQKLSDLRKLMRSMGADFMTEQQRIKEEFFIDLTKIAVGEITEIDGPEAIVKLEKDEGLVKARLI